MACKKCGAELAQGAAFCHRCGAPTAELKASPTLLQPKVPDRASLEAERARLIDEYKSTHDERVGARIRELNAALRSGSKIAEPSPSKARTSRKPLFSPPQQSLKVAVALLVVFVFLKVCTSGPSKQEQAEDKQLEETAVQSVKDNFEPSYDMLALNPDTSTGMWYAIKDDGVHQCVGKCFLVVYSIQVLPTGETSPKTMRFEWLYDTRRSSPLFANTEARTYFEPKQSAPQ